MATNARLTTSYRQQLRVLPRRVPTWLWLVAAVGALIYLPTWVQDVAPLGIGLGDLDFALVWVMGSVALNLLVGYGGQLSMGHSAFLAIGAFGGGVLGVQAGLPFWLTVLGAGIMGAVCGVVVGLPSLRVRGLYLLLSTLALHFIVLYLFLRYQLDNFGAAGVPFDYPSLLGVTFDSDEKWYFLLLVCAAATILIVRNLLRTREGRALVAVRDSDIAAGAAGVNVSAIKLKAFAFSSFIVSFAGALYAYYLTNASVETYSLELVIGFYAMVIIGGMGSLLGSVLGALLWSFLPPVINTMSDQVDPTTPVLGNLLVENVDQFNVLIFGVVIILILIFKPSGLNGMWQSIRRSVRRWPYTS